MEGLAQELQCESWSVLWQLRGCLMRAQQPALSSHGMAIVASTLSPSATPSQWWLLKENQGAALTWCYKGPLKQLSDPSNTRVFSLLAYVSFLRHVNIMLSNERPQFNSHLGTLRRDFSGSRYSNANLGSEILVYAGHFTSLVKNQWVALRSLLYLSEVSRIHQVFQWPWDFKWKLDV